MRKMKADSVAELVTMAAKLHLAPCAERWTFHRQTVLRSPDGDLTGLFDTIDCRVGVFAQKLDPRLLRAGVVFRGLDEIHEGHNRAFQPGTQLPLAMRPSGAKAWCARASENMSGYTRAPRCSSGMRSAHRPRLPPTIDGEADSSNA